MRVSWILNDLLSLYHLSLYCKIADTGWFHTLVTLSSSEMLLMPLAKQLGDI